ncbi:ankyrin repeat-containing protein [Tanacetum coccineum]
MESVKETVKIRVCKGGVCERVDGALKYMPLNCVKRTLILPLLSSYSCLLEAVSERLEINANSDFMVTYNSDNDIVEDPQSDSANCKLKYVVGSPKTKKPNERDLLDDEKLQPFEENIMGSVFGKIKIDYWLRMRVRESDEDAGKQNSRLRTGLTWKYGHLDIGFAFLTKLKECIIGKQDHLTIISDGAVSIASAIKNVFPNAFHGRCCRHLLMNLREKCPRFISKEELFWKACKAYRISDFEERFSTLRDWLPSIANKLDMIGLEKWARVHFPGMRYNYMTSNSAESVNALSRHSRKLPICMMIDWFIKSLQQWYFEHRQTADEHKHELTPWAEAKLAQRIAKSATWTVRPAANYLYNVVDYYKNATVDLNTRTCSCGQWQLSGLPCGHLIAVMRHLRQSSANQFAFSCFKTSVWRASYNEVIYDVGHPSEWDQPDGLITVHFPPWMDKREPGRRSKTVIALDLRANKLHQNHVHDVLKDNTRVLWYFQLAQLRKTSEIREGGHNGEMSTQEYVRKITEERARISFLRLVVLGP